MEMHIILAWLFSRFELKLADESQLGISWADRVVARPASHLRIKVLQDRWDLIESQ
jgi:hypothetical protein